MEYLLVMLTAMWALSPYRSQAFIPGVRPDSAVEVCNAALRYQPAAELGLKPAPDNPFTIRTNMSEYIPGEPIEVTVAGTRPFRGLILQARQFGMSSVIGNFRLPSKNVRPYNCDSVNDTVVTWLTRKTKSFKFIWKPPPNDAGSLRLVGTLFDNSTNYYPNVTSRTMRKGFAPIDLSTCGKTKGCFRYPGGAPHNCNASQCDYVFTYRTYKGNEAHFELSAVAGWVAIGFSSDNKMGGDDVFMCVRTRVSADVLHYWINVAHQTPKLQKHNPLYDRQVDVTDNRRISCRFKRPLKLTDNEFNVDLNNDWFQLYAWGPVSASGSIMRHTLEKPPTSSDKMTLWRKTDITGGVTSVMRSSSASSSIWLAIVILSHAVLWNERNSWDHFNK